jgi:spore coat protein A, manganese oxidase
MYMKPSKSLFLLLALGSSLIDEAVASSLAPGLLDPDVQPKFVESVPDALASPIILPNGLFKLNVYSIKQYTGLIDPSTKGPLMTPLFGYGTSAQTASWPGPTLVAQKDVWSKIQWGNELYNISSHPFTTLKGTSVLDTSLHWAYALPSYTGYNIAKDGIPIVTHLHGSHSGPDRDGLPEHFYTPGWRIKGPDWKFKNYMYPNDQPAAALFYHDHVLGITRLNVYAGLAGLYIIRDNVDTGTSKNPLKLPAGDCEKAYAIQDRMFKTNGELFYPSSDGEPFYEDFILSTTANWSSSRPSAFAEFFGDFMVVNGKIWPKQDVKRRRYRLRFLNGCDSRFLVVKFTAVPAGSKQTTGGIPLSTVIGTDQGLLDTPIPNVFRSLIETGGRLDIVIDFSGCTQGERIIMTNEGGDSAFGGDIPGPQNYNYTNQIMAFDVNPTSVTDDSGVPSWNFTPEVLKPDNTSKVPRRVGLFEGRDQYNRLQPLPGGEKVPNIVETFTWSEPMTETIKINQIEEWEIYNFSPDAVSYFECAQTLYQA